MSGGRPWNKSELNAIRNNYERVGPELLGKLMKRTSNAVSWKAMELRKREGLARRNPNEDYARVDAMVQIVFRR